MRSYTVETRASRLRSADHRPCSRRWPRWLGAALLGGVAYGGLVRPRLLRWGATAEEASAPFPGDDLVPGASYASTRAVTVLTPPAAVWAWLVQIGQGRGGFYTYDRDDPGTRAPDHNRAGEPFSSSSTTGMLLPC
jgi:hypothetical protein